MCNLQAKLGATPVTALGIVPDGVAGAHPNPLGDGAILALLLGQRALGAEGFMRRLCKEEEIDGWSGQFASVAGGAREFAHKVGSGGAQGHTTLKSKENTEHRTQGLSYL